MIKTTEDLEEPCKIMEGFLDPEKCRYLIDTYKDQCKRSTVVDGAGKDIVDAARTSSTYFMPDNDPVIVELRQKAAAMAGVPENNVEGLQLVRYAKGEQYKFHYDYFDAIRDNQRVHTFLVYLNDLELEDGGSTIFKRYKIKVYPRTGRCVWFRNMIDDELNEMSLHSGEEVLSDEKIKYAVNIWIRQKEVMTYETSKAHMTSKAHKASNDQSTTTTTTATGISIATVLIGLLVGVLAILILFSIIALFIDVKDMPRMLRGSATAIRRVLRT
jgi:prolyl 4-hydroxylase